MRMKLDKGDGMRDRRILVWVMRMRCIVSKQTVIATCYTLVYSGNRWDCDKPGV